MSQKFDKALRKYCKVHGMNPKKARTLIESTDPAKAAMFKKEVLNFLKTTNEVRKALILNSGIILNPKS